MMTAVFISYLTLTNIILAGLLAKRNRLTSKILEAEVSNYYKSRS